MYKQHCRLLASGLTVLALGCASSVFAAKPVDLSRQSVSFLSSFVVLSQSGIKQLSTKVDFNKTEHVRVAQTYAGYPVWGADAIVHVPHGQKDSITKIMATKNSAATMNGTMYQELNQDLHNAPAFIFKSEQANKALQHAVQAYEKKSAAKVEIKDSKSSLIVFVDRNNKAHWAYLVEFYANAGKPTVAKPIAIMDAVSFEVYQQWNNLQTIEDAAGGGFGGNEKAGKFTYDGLKGNLPKLTITREASQNLCFLKSSDVIVKDVRTNYAPYQFGCETPNAEHDNVFWNGDLDAVNGGYSPADDAMFAGMVIKNMYQEWYGVSPLVEADGTPMQLSMCVHMENFDNAYWDGRQMTFGDGEYMFYPLVSIGVAAHEISHGFTEQNSHLTYWAQSGGMNEAFSDIAAQAAEYYAYGHNSWQIGPEIFKDPDGALRYMDQPSKDCKGGQAGNWCSIDNAKDYNDGIDVHYSSGVYNRLFYLLGTSKGWNTRMAFNVMVQANENYWTADSTFAAGACGLLKATEDYHKIDHRYDVASVKAAIAGVGIDYTSCN